MESVGWVLGRRKGLDRIVKGRWTGTPCRQLDGGDHLAGVSIWARTVVKAGSVVSWSLPEGVLAIPAGWWGD